MIAATRLGTAALAALMCAGPALAGSGSAYPEAGVVSPTAKQLYEAARQAEEKLRGSETAMRNRDRWQDVARKYRSVVLSFPRSGYCDDALHYEGGVYRDAAERFDDRRFAVRGPPTPLLSSSAGIRRAAGSRRLCMNRYVSTPAASTTKPRRGAPSNGSGSARRAPPRPGWRPPSWRSPRPRPAPPARPGGRRTGQGEPSRSGRRCSPPIHRRPCRTSVTGSGTHTPGW